MQTQKFMTFLPEIQIENSELSKSGEDHVYSISSGIFN